MSPPAPPYSSGIGMPISPSSARLRDDLVGEAVLAVELLRHRRDPLLGERAHGLRAEARARPRGRGPLRPEAAGQLGEQPHAVAGRPEPRVVVAAAALEVGGAGDVEMRPGPLARERLAGRRPRGSGTPAGGPRSSSGRRTPSRCSGGSARAAAAARHGRRWLRPPPDLGRTRRRRSRTARRRGRPWRRRSPPVSVARSSTCVAPDSRANQSASARISRPSASVLAISIVLPLSAVTMSPGR